MIKISLQLIFILAFGSRVYAQPSDSWPMFRGNQCLTGVSETAMPSSPKLLWTFQTGDNIKSAPVVADGKVVVGSTDGLVYCLDTQ
ncbi:MAG: PQQ-binding-like beta-propeller repeat protein, partial [Draconibacterium sp.]